jgi:branched-chain amino acid transport system ATP-binding protein
MEERSFLIETRDLTKNFGGLRAVNGLSIQVERGTITSLIGPNGAGKTTVFNLLTGFLKPSGGRIYFKGKSLTDLSPHRISRMGIGRTFQLVRVFPMLTVLDNVMLGFRKKKGESVLGGLLRTRQVREEERESHEKALDLIELVGLKAYQDQYAINLGFGQQKLVEIARALATEPDIVLLDEPMAGLSGEMKANMISLMTHLKSQGRTVFFIEHNMAVVMGISERIFVINHGEQIASGSPAEILKNEKVIQAYLGQEQ